MRMVFLLCVVFLLACGNPVDSRMCEGNGALVVERLAGRYVIDVGGDSGTLDLVAAPQNGPALEVLARGFVDLPRGRADSIVVYRSGTSVFGRVGAGDP